MFTLNLTHRENSVMSRYINKVRGEVDVIGEDLRARKSKIELSSRTKLVTYRQINPSLFNHPLPSLVSPLKN